MEPEEAVEDTGEKEPSDKTEQGVGFLYVCPAGYIHIFSVRSFPFGEFISLQCVYISLVRSYLLGTRFIRDFKFPLVRRGAYLFITRISLWYP